MAIRLTEQQQRQLFAHIKDKWGDHRACPMCTKTKWSVDGSVYRLAALTTDPTSVHGVVQPLATVRCVNCSFVALIHLTQSGIASPDDLSLGQPQAHVVVPHAPSEPVSIPLDNAVDENDETH